MSNIEPLTTKEIVENIKVVYREFSNQILNDNPLLFGLTEATPTILIAFEKKVPNDKNKYFNERSSYFYVSNYDQVIDILKMLKIHREVSESEILNKYKKITFDENKSVYLKVTSFKPINF